MTRARALMDLANPYGLPPLERVFYPRTVPAKGERVAIGDDRAHYRSRAFGPWHLPGLVHALTETALVVEVPASGLQASFSFWDPHWTIVPALDVTFWHACWACRRLGEVLMNPGRICEACGGKKVIAHVPCAECKGFGYFPGSDLIVDCLECVQGAKPYDPFSNRAKRREAKRQQRRYVMPPLAEGEGFEPPF